MKFQSEYSRLFGTEGTYTSAKAHSKHGTDVIRGPYAALIEELYAAGVNVYKTDNKRVDGKEPQRFIIDK